MKARVIGFLCTLVLTSAVSAGTFEMDQTVLRDAAVSSNKKCVSVSNGFTVRASTPNGRVSTYRTNNPNHGHGIYIGSPSGPPFTQSNTTAPPEGIYTLTFEPAVTSIVLTFDWLSNDHQPAEALWAFATDRGAAKIRFQPAGSSSSFDGRTILAENGRGAGVLTYSGKPFTSFKFKHRQHPRNIGFTFKNIEATTAPTSC